jgi:allophanate hydrolase subunit 1
MITVCTLFSTLPGCSSTKPTPDQTINRYSEKLREAVSTSVPEEQPKAQMLLIVDRLEALHLRFSQETSDFVETYRKLNVDYDSTRPAFDQLFSDYNAKRIKARKEALDLHFQLASLATAGEWEAIGRAEKKLYEEADAAVPAEESTK